VDLVRERHAKTRHAEIVIGAVLHVPANVTHDTDAVGHADFQTAAKLAGDISAGVVSPYTMTTFFFWNRIVGRMDMVSLKKFPVRPRAAADSAHAAPNIGREARTADGVTQRECPEAATADI